MAAELLAKAEHSGLGIEMPEAQGLLENAEFTKDMLAVTATGQDTLLHLAAKNADYAILKLVLEAYKSHGMLKDALSVKNSQDKNPLRVAIDNGGVDHTKHLFKECQELCPDAITDSKSGYTILHQSVAVGERSVELVSFLLSQKECKPMLSVIWEDDTFADIKMTPLEVADDAIRSLQQRYQQNLKTAEKRIKERKMSPRVAEMERKNQTRISEQWLEIAKEIYRMLKSHA